MRVVCLLFLRINWVLTQAAKTGFPRCFQCARRSMTSSEWAADNWGFMTFLAFRLPLACILLHHISVVLKGQPPAAPDISTGVPRGSLLRPLTLALSLNALPYCSQFDHLHSPELTICFTWTDTSLPIPRKQGENMATSSWSVGKPWLRGGGGTITLHKNIACQPMHQLKSLMGTRCVHETEKSLDLPHSLLRLHCVYPALQQSCHLV